jgi:hypothetical protein
VIDLYNTSAQSSFNISKTGIEIKGEPTFDEWLSCGQLLANAEKGLHFCIGDWINYGEAKWGEKYKEAIEKTGFEYQTLANDKYVASKIDFSLRKEKLSFTHHFVVAPYEPHEQSFLLEQAETLNLSAKQLREQKDRLLHPPKVVESGQVWNLGEHLLYCGDSSDESFIKLCQQSSAAFAFADPPYNAGVAEWDNDFTWRHDYLSDLAPIVAVTPGISAIKNFMRTTKMPYKWSMSYWIDNGMTRGALGFGNWMYVALFTEGSVYRNAQDLARIADEEMDDMGRISVTGGDRDDLKHKGRKPIELLSHLLNLFTKSEEVVIDPFLGTGTTLIACEKEGRRCIGAEVNPEFCESIIRRWERQTSREATL